MVIGNNTPVALAPIFAVIGIPATDTDVIEPVLTGVPAYVNPPCAIAPAAFADVTVITKSLAGVAPPNRVPANVIVSFATYPVPY